MLIHPSLQPCLRRTYSRSRVTTAALYQVSIATATSPASRLQPDIPHSSISYYWDTLPPTPAQLSHATKFFRQHAPQFLWSAPKFHSMSFGDSPEVCFLGRSNVGKSSLLNALLGRKMAHTSSKPGHTKMMNAFSIGPPRDTGKKRLVILDMPGYGKGGRAEWGEEVIKYLVKRNHLMRAFLLVDVEHGIKDNDLQLLSLFQQEAIPYQIVLSKVDRLLLPGNRSPSEAALKYRTDTLRQSMQLVKDAIETKTPDDGGAIGEIIACSSEKSVQGQRLGMDLLQFAILRAAEMEYRPVVKTTPSQRIVPFDEIF